MRRVPAWAALAGAVGCAGCAAVVPGPPGDLLKAQSELGRVWASPQTEWAPDEIAEADAALDQAEATFGAALRDSGSRWNAEDDAYVALRMAQRARIAMLYEAEREALRKARGAVRRLTDDGERRQASLVDQANRRRALEEARARVATARRAALERARRAGDQILD